MPQTIKGIKYLIEHSYLGFRFHGWTEQPSLKTVQGMLNNSVRFTLGDVKFRTMVSCRTDAKVSALQNFALLVIDQNIDPEEFKEQLNLNLPPDVRIENITLVDEKFDIRGAKQKTYSYVFGTHRIPPYLASMVFPAGELNMDALKSGLDTLTGKHNFIAFSSQRSKVKNPECEIRSVQLEHPSFLPILGADQLYAVTFQGDRFLYNQIRLMMGRLFQLGRNEIDMRDLKRDLESPSEETLKEIAPASGLHLLNVQFD